MIRFILLFLQISFCCGEQFHLGAYTAVTTNEILNALKHEGFEEAMRVAKAEVEVVMVTEATAASLGGLPAAAASGGGYMAYKVGGKLYLTAQKAWTALVKINPSLESGAVKNAFGNWLGKNGVAKAEVLTLTSPKMVEHHIFNKFRGQSSVSQKYRDFFKKHSINVDDFCIAVSESSHKQKIHVAQNNWTTQWKKWIDTNPNASTKQVYQFAGEMMDRYGVAHHEIKKYLK